VLITPPATCTKKYADNGLKECSDTCAANYKDVEGLCVLITSNIC
jgi:hypothetical protein